MAARPSPDSSFLVKQSTRSRPEQQAVHRVLTDEGNQFVAHRGNDEEQIRVFLLLQNPAVGRELFGPAHFHVRPFARNEVSMRQAAEVARQLSGGAAVTAEAVSSRLHERYTHVDLDTLYARAVPVDGIDRKG